jgi:hypothetical protein
MFKKIEKAAACEMRSVIRFLNARNMKPADSHRQLCEVCGDHAMSESMVRRWVRHFNEIRDNVLNDVPSGRPSVVNEDLVRACSGKEDSREQTIRHFVTSLHFLQMSGSLLHEIVSVKLRFRKLCAEDAYG